jgi:hypothetical protein
MFRRLLGANPLRDYWSAILSTGQSAEGVLADVKLEEGPRLEVFHGQWLSILSGQFT